MYWLIIFAGIALSILCAIGAVVCVNVATPIGYCLAAMFLILVIALWVWLFVFSKQER